MSKNFLAVVNYNCDGVGSYRCIVCETDPVKYVAQVAKEVSEAMSLLVEHNWDEINCSDLDALHGSFGQGEYPEDGWDCGNVMELVQRIPQLAAKEYQASSCELATDSFWYQQLIGFLNDVFSDASGVWISVEGPLVVSLPRLLELEASDCKFYRMGNAFTIWLGQLAVVAHWDWTRNVEQSMMRALNTLVEEFNQRNAFN